MYVIKKYVKINLKQKNKSCRYINNKICNEFIAYIL